MKEHPIIFNGEMVRAILDGRKTQTRRVVKLPKGFPADSVGEFRKATAWPRGFPDATKDQWRACLKKFNYWSPLIRCPYGKVGDALWVREEWRVDSCGTWWKVNGVGGRRGAHIDYRADVDREFVDLSDDGEFCKAEHYCKKHREGAYSPSRHMFRWASRITLEITNIRVERVQDISEEDILAEGVRLPPTELCPLVNTGSKLMVRFESLWDSINADRGFSWAEDVWVWVIDFKPKDDPLDLTLMGDVLSRMHKAVIEQPTEGVI